MHAAGRGWLSRRGGGSQGGLLVTGHHLSPAQPGCPTTFRLLKWGLEAQLVLGFSLLSNAAPGCGHPLLCSRDEGSREAVVLRFQRVVGPAPALLPSGSCSVSQTTVSTQPVWAPHARGIPPGSRSLAATWHPQASRCGHLGKLGSSSQDQAGRAQAPTGHPHGGQAQSPVSPASGLRCSTGLVVPRQSRPYSACLRCLDPICRGLMAELTLKQSKEGVGKPSGARTSPASWGPASRSYPAGLPQSWRPRRGSVSGKTHSMERRAGHSHQAPRIPGAQIPVAPGSPEGAGKVWALTSWRQMAP